MTLDMDSLLHLPDVLHASPSFLNFTMLNNFVAYTYSGIECNVSRAYRAYGTFMGTLANNLNLG